MRIAFITDSFAPGTTYICNVLPRFFEELGIHCTVITSTARPYRDKLSGASNVVWGDGRVLEAGRTFDIDGVTVQVLDHVEGPGGVRLLGLDEALRMWCKRSRQQASSCGRLRGSESASDLSFLLEITRDIVSFQPLAWQSREASFTT
jgi:uncharacterized protein YigA (DUF484 family)